MSRSNLAIENFTDDFMIIDSSDEIVEYNNNDLAILSGATLSSRTVEAITCERFLQNGFKYVETIIADSADENAKLKQQSFCHIFEKNGKKIAFLPNTASIPHGKDIPGHNDIRKTLIAYRSALKTNKNLKDCSKIICVHVEHDGKKGGHFTIIDVTLPEDTQLSPSRRLANATINYIDSYPAAFKRVFNRNKTKTVQDAFQSVWGTTKNRFNRIFLAKQYNATDCGRHASRVAVNVADNQKPGDYRLNDIKGGKKTHRNADNELYKKATKNKTAIYSHLFDNASSNDHSLAVEKNEESSQIEFNEVVLSTNMKRRSNTIRHDKEVVNSLIPSYSKILEIEEIILSKQDWKLGKLFGGNNLRVGNDTIRVSGSARDIMYHIRQYHQDAKRLVEQNLTYSNDGATSVTPEITQKLNSNYSSLMKKLLRIVADKNKFTNNQFLQFFGKRAPSTCLVYQTINQVLTIDNAAKIA